VDGQAWSADPFVLRQSNGRLYARGSTDMKGFVSACLAAVPDIKARNLARPLHLFISYDEEVGCHGARRLLQDLDESGLKPTMCVVGEPSGMQPVLAHKGKLNLRVRVRGLFEAFGAEILETSPEEHDAHMALIQVLVHDISQRKMLEQQIILQNKNLQDANQRLREVDEMKTEFLANISHELRTPLSVIIAYTEALRDGLVGEADRKHFLDVIGENGQGLLRLINDLLDLSKLEVSGAMLSFTLSHIHDVIRVLWPKLTTAAEAKGIEVSFKPGYEIPVVYIDNKRISQVVMSLAQNAVKFTEKGGKIEVSTRRSDNGVVVQVTDTGAGIADEQIASVFDTFRQLDGSSTRRVGGLGIGLAIAKHIIELHGGKIWVESKAGVGSTFCFMIPVETDEVMRTSSDSGDALTRMVPANVTSVDAWIDSQLGDAGA
jgi:signal transduction histidine kinase